MVCDTVSNDDLASWWCQEGQLLNNGLVLCRHLHLSGICWHSTMETISTSTLSKGPTWSLKEWRKIFTFTSYNFCISTIVLTIWNNNLHGSQLFTSWNKAIRSPIHQPKVYVKMEVTLIRYSLQYNQEPTQRETSCYQTLYDERIFTTMCYTRHPHPVLHMRDV